MDFAEPPDECGSCQSVLDPLGNCWSCDGGRIAREANDNDMIGSFTGLRLDLPPGEHPFDWFLQSLIGILGERKAAAFVAVPPPTRLRRGSAKR